MVEYWIEQNKYRKHLYYFKFAECPLRLAKYSTKTKKLVVYYPSDINMSAIKVFVKICEQGEKNGNINK